MIVDYSAKRLTTLQIFYYMPDYQSIIQEFVWQYTDLKPKFPRTHKFLMHWYENIEAIPEEIIVTYTDRHENVRHANIMADINNFPFRRF